MISFEGSFGNLNVSSSTSFLVNFFFPFIDITCFFSSLKLQYCQTIVLLSKRKLFKEPFFCKSDDGQAIFRHEKCRLPKSTARFPAKQRGHSPLPRRVVLGLPSPSPSPRVCTNGQAYTDVTTKISRIDSLSNLLGNGAPLAGFARGLR